MASPAISVAMSVYNGERFLAEAIESILAQTFGDFEFLIVDDGSRDSSRAIIEAYAAKDQRIRPILRENRGLIASLNQLIRESRAPVVARMDDDDISHPERFAKQMAFLDANVEWILDHELAHALILAFELPVLGQEEDAADAFASASVSARHPEREAATRLALVAEAWFLEAERSEAEGTIDYFGEHDLDRQRAFRVLCVANGADPAIADAALGHADVPDGGFDGCEIDRDLATESWDVLIGPNTLYDDEPPADVSVAYGPAEGLDDERAALEATGALEALAEEAASTYALFDPLTIEGRACGETEAFHDAEEGAIVICYELVADLLALRADARTADADAAGSAGADAAGSAGADGANADADAVPGATDATDATGPGGPADDASTRQDDAPAR